MAQIILRQANVITSTGGTVKGSPLTNAEVDNNFANLNVAANTLDSNVGAVLSLSTINKTNVVSAINELRGNLTSSAGLATLLSDETGTGLFVANVSPIISSPTFANSAISVTAANATSNTMVATTQFVNNQIGNSPSLAGTPQSVTAANATSNSMIATTAFVNNQLGIYDDSPAFTGTPQSVTAANATSNAMIATTQFVNNQIALNPNILLPTINNIKLGYTTTVTAGGTTTLVAGSTYQQLFTGSANQTIVLPVTSTLAIGQTFHIENNGTGTLTIQSSGTNNIATVPPLMTVVVTCINTAGTDNTIWDYDYHAFGGISGSSGNVVVSVSPSFTGTPQSVTAANAASNAMIATTQFVNNQIGNSPALFGTPQAVTAANATSNSMIATTQFVLNQIGVTVTSISPSFTGTPQSVTAANATSNAMIATTQFVNNQIQNSPNIQSPTINNIRLGYTSTATAGGTTTLTNQSTYFQLFTGSANQTVVLPVASTMSNGTSFHIENQGTGILTVQSSGLNNVVTIPALYSILCTLNSTSGTDNTIWDYDYHGFGGISGSSGNVVVSVSPTFSGTPQSVTAANATSNAMVATTAFVNNQIGNSPALFGTPQAVTATAGTSNAMIATTQFVQDAVGNGVTTGKSIAMAMIFGY